MRELQARPSIYKKFPAFLRSFFNFKGEDRQPSCYQLLGLQDLAPYTDDNLA